MTAVPRIVTGLVALGTMLLLVFDAALGIFPTASDTARETRVRVAQALAIQVAELLQTQDPRGAERVLRSVQSRDPDIVSLGLRRADGALVAQAGAHAQHWNPDKAGTVNALTVDIGSASGRWGALEVTFLPLHRRDATAWLLSGAVPLVLLFGVFGSVLYYLYLRRVLQHLDPTSAVPERVRTAFDTLSEGVIVLDAKGRILLANRGFDALQPAGGTQPLVGATLSSLGWLVAAQEGDGGERPWEVTLRTRQARRGVPFRVVADGIVTAALSVNCSPLTDERGSLRGCIVTVVDVTALERSHEQLLEVLSDLAASKQELEVKNHELELMATHDALSGCLNRRALFARGEAMFADAVARRRPLACVLADIDHFKSINDRLGHASGDRAIQRFAALLREGVRPHDAVGRYGGEEFCLLLVGADAALARQIAEAIRVAVAGSGPIGHDGSRSMGITASFGVATTAGGAATLAELIDRADRAMYLAKQAGRNRVVVDDVVDVPLHATLEIAA